MGYLWNSKRDEALKISLRVGKGNMKSKNQYEWSCGGHDGSVFAECPEGRGLR